MFIQQTQFLSGTSTERPQTSKDKTHHGEGLPREVLWVRRGRGENLLYIYNLFRESNVHRLFQNKDYRYIFLCFSSAPSAPR